MKVIITIKKGIADVVKKDAGIELTIIDHDTQEDKPSVYVYSKKETI